MKRCTGSRADNFIKEQTIKVRVREKSDKAVALSVSKLGHYDMGGFDGI